MSNMTDEELHEHMDALTLSNEFVWLMSASYTVLCMQSGLALIETGINPSNMQINTIVRYLTSFALVGIIFFVCGWAFSLGGNVEHLPKTGNKNPFAGDKEFFLDGLPDDGLVRFLFEFLAASLAVTFGSGALMGRMKYIAFVIYTLFAGAFIYPFPAHWQLTVDGWLYKLGAREQAGAASICICGGAMALATTLFLGPRTTPYLDNKFVTMHSNPGQTVLGTLVLCCAWLALNAAAFRTVAGVADLKAAEGAENSIIGFGFSVVIGAIYSFKRNNWDYVDVFDLTRCAIAGLVGLSACSNTIQPFESMIISCITGLLVIKANELVARFRIDDPAGNVAVYLVCGWWSMIAAGLFNNEEKALDISDGLFRGGNIHFLGANILASVAQTVWSFGLTYAFLYMLNLIFPIRVSVEEEQRGPDASEHGIVTVDVRTRRQADKAQLYEDRRAKLEAASAAISDLQYELCHIGEQVFITKTTRKAANIGQPSRIPWDSHRKPHVPGEASRRLSHLAELTSHGGRLSVSSANRPFSPARFSIASNASHISEVSGKMASPQQPGKGLSSADAASTAEQLHEVYRRLSRVLPQPSIVVLDETEHVTACFDARASSTDLDSFCPVMKIVLN